MTEPRYRYGLIPNPKRWPRPRSDWLRPAVALLVVVLVVTGAVTVAPWLGGRLACRDGLPSGEIYSAGGDCVGITDGPYAFEVPGFDQVLGRIHDQNEAAAGACGAQSGPPVTIGVLMSLNHPNSGSRALHELEGFAAGQARANQPGCLRALRLRVGHTGPTEREAEHIAGLFRKASDIIAVVGLGLSGVDAARAANLLGNPVEEDGTQPVPMVADLITAEGFDSDGTSDAAGCADEATLRAGVGGSYFFRVAYRNSQQVDELAELLGTTVRPTFIVTPDDSRDPYTCTGLRRLRELYQMRPPQVPEVRFSVTNTATVAQVAQRVCGAKGAVSVFYVARSRDLGRFLTGLAERYDNGRCEAESVTVASISDAVRMRVPEIDPGLEVPRRQALGSAAFAEGRLRLVYTPLADPDALRHPGTGGGPEFNALEQQFEKARFDVADLDDGWAISAYDALFTVAAAVQSLDSDQPVTRGGVRAAVAAFSAADERSQLSAANGRIGFENNGNRAGSPVTVRLCPLGSADPAGHTRTVTQVGAPADRASC